MIAHRDALAQLSQARIVQTVAQLWLAHEHDLEELAVVGFEIREQAQRTLVALQALPTRQRIVACMRFLDEKSQREIAATLQLSEGYVSKLLARASERLRRVALEIGDGDGHTP